MRLIVLGDEANDLPEMPTAVSEIWTYFPGGDDVLQWVIDSGLAVTLVAADPSEIPDEVLDAVVQVIESDNPEKYLVDNAFPSDVVLMSWRDTDDQHRMLGRLSDRGVAVQDMLDGFRQLLLEDPIKELAKQITEQVTREVLRQVRAEVREYLEDTPRGRRYRQINARE